MQGEPGHGRGEGEVAQPEIGILEAEDDTARPEADSAGPEADSARPEVDVGRPEGVTRRESFKLASAALLLATGLGIPLRAFAERPEEATDLVIKWYWTREPDKEADGRLIHTQEVVERAARLLLSGEPGALQIKWYSTDGRTSELLGDYYLPPELQMKIEYLGREPQIKRG